MDNKLNNKVSFFKSIYDKENCILTISDILAIIKGETLESQVKAIRTEKDKEKRDLLKRKLPAITTSGTFDGNRQQNNFLKHSGLIQVDLDKVSSLKDTRKSLIQDPHILALFDSPSGTGLKVIVKITDDVNEHIQTFNSLEAYFFLQYRLWLDPSCKDLCRLMYLSHDTDLHINAYSKVFNKSFITEAEIKFVEAVKRRNKKTAFSTGDRNNYIYRMSCECRRVKISYNDCVSMSIRVYADETFTHREIENTIRSAYKNISPPMEEEEPTTSLLLIRPAQQCMRDAANQPAPQMLFSEFWHEGELCILFADTNVGKSILAVQIADSISKGLAISGFKLDAIKQSVFLMDFELSDKQFQTRYSQDFTNDYQFDQNFSRIVINPEADDFDRYEQEIFENLEQQLSEKKCRILILDNISFLKAESTEKARDALPLMKRLLRLKRKYTISILVLAHTPKRNCSRPITENDLAGSKLLANFADSIFAIGKSTKDENLRYLKQLKARSTKILYGSDNVITCVIEKVSSFLQFKLEGFSSEFDHLKEKSPSDTEKIKSNITEIYQNRPHLSTRQIAKECDTNHMMVKRTLEKYKNK